MAVVTKSKSRREERKEGKKKFIRLESKLSWDQGNKSLISLRNDVDGAGRKRAELFYNSVGEKKTDEDVLAQ